MGIGKVRELPPEKIDAYMEELEKAFPAAEVVEESSTGSMFD
jgi:methyl coenzyme M reductase alpha subunit